MKAFILKAFGLVLALSVLSIPSFAETEATFRTPAKRYGSAYSVKIILRRDGFTYDIPVWIKPDQKISTLDHDQLADLGWIYKDLKPEDISMSGESLDAPRFQNLKTEWVYIPDFPKSCCYGILGQDVLREYDIRFDPNPPAHLEWTKITSSQPVKIPAKLQKELPALFTVRATHGVFGKRKVDLSLTPYRLNLAKAELSFEPEWIDPKAAATPLKRPLFQYEFIPPYRLLLVVSIPPAYLKKARNVGFKSSMKITHINSLPVGTLNHFEMDDLLTGRKSKQLLIRTAQGVFTFDFEKDEFIPSEGIHAPPRTGKN